MATALSALSPGSTISLNLNGSPYQFIVLHQGNPDPGLYDASCEGTWLQMKDIHSKASWGDTFQYADSTAHTWLNTTFLGYFDADIQELIQPVKIPYVDADTSTVHSGAEGLACKLFYLSPCEMGLVPANYEGMLTDGACLAYYQGSADSDPIRNASYNGDPTTYWTRSPKASNEEFVWCIRSADDGLCTAMRCYLSTVGRRPALILPSSLAIDEDGTILPNAAPVISSPSGGAGANLGIRNTPFLLEYTASDPEGSSLTLTEQLDDQTTRTLTAASGTAQHFEALNDPPTFLQLANGVHTIQITASDGMASGSLSMTFTKAVTSASLTMTQPIASSAPITLATLTVDGLIPSDAAFTVEVTNNALDPQPVWQDATAEVRDGQNILFDNHAAEKSPAFNFKIQAARGASGTGGYISRVAGAFQ